MIDRQLVAGPTCRGYGRDLGLHHCTHESGVGGAEKKKNSRKVKPNPPPALTPHHADGKPYPVQ